MSKILLIEPNTVLGRLYNDALRLDGHTVQWVTGAQAAIDAADTDMPDLVVLELQLPGHDGVEFLHEFRSYPEWQRVPIVVHTALQPASLAPVEQTLQTSFGVQVVLYKPKTTIQNLARTIRQVV